MMEKTLARRSDPDTSHSAAASVVAGLSRQHAAVLRVLATAGGRPLAAEQISDIAGFDVWRRMNELGAAGHIEQTSGLHTNRSGRAAHQFRLTTGQLELL